ncbi:unnamed protein product, partial [Pleuronectes platessa]
KDGDFTHFPPLLSVSLPTCGRTKRKRSQSPVAHHSEQEAGLDGGRNAVRCQGPLRENALCGTSALKRAQRREGQARELAHHKTDPLGSKKRVIPHLVQQSPHDKSPSYSREKQQRNENTPLSKPLRVSPLRRRRNRSAAAEPSKHEPDVALVGPCNCLHTAQQVQTQLVLSPQSSPSLCSGLVWTAAAVRLAPAHLLINAPSSESSEGAKLSSV